MGGGGRGGEEEEEEGGILGLVVEGSLPFNPVSLSFSGEFFRDSTSKRKAFY